VLLYSGSSSVTLFFGCLIPEDETTSILSTRSTKTVYSKPHVIYVKWLCFEVKLSYGEVLGDRSTMYIRVTFYWGYLTVLWLFHLVCILYCGWFNWFCNVCVFW
jgi:hypothetical protein